MQLKQKWNPLRMALRITRVTLIVLPGDGMATTNPRRVVTTDPRGKATTDPSGMAATGPREGPYPCAPLAKNREMINAPTVLSVAVHTTLQEIVIGRQMANGYPERQEVAGTMQESQSPSVATVEKKGG
jgi:hypothetical protein